jgi:hypothetical protein
MDSRIVEELATRLPKAELAKIIKGVLECGKRNIPVTEADLIRAITFGANAVFRPLIGADIAQAGVAQAGVPPAPRVAFTQSARQAARREGMPVVPRLEPPAAAPPAIR